MKREKSYAGRGDDIIAPQNLSRREPARTRMFANSCSLPSPTPTTYRILRKRRAQGREENANPLQFLDKREVDR